MSKQKRQVEWSFDFEDIGSRINQFFSDMSGGDMEVETADLQVLLDNTQTAKAEIDFSVGRANINALQSSSDDLFSAQIVYVGEYEFDVTGDVDKQIVLKQKGRFPRNIGKMIGNAKDLIWNIGLAQNIPYALHLKGGVGEADIDLTNLTVHDLKLDTGVGKVVVTLPIQDDALDARIQGGIGETQVVVPAGMTGSLEIHGGVGEVVVTVDPNAAIRLEASAGLGEVKLPPSFDRVSGQANVVGINGVWQTRDFAIADKQIQIEYKGGIGSFRVKHFELV